LPGSPSQNLEGLGVQIPKAIGLHPVGDDPEQDVAGEMLWRRPSELVLPAGSQTLRIETAQKRDLVLDCSPLK